MHDRLVRALGPAAVLAMWMTGVTSACAQAPRPGDAEADRVARSITAGKLATHLGLIAHDSTVW